MKKMPPAEPPEPTPKRTPSGKVSKTEKYRNRGHRVAQLEQEYKELPARTRNSLAEFMIRKGVAATAAVLDTFIAFSIADKAQAILQEVKGYVAEDQSYPIPAKYLGRALKDMNAVGSPGKAKSRIDIMAFFHTGLARAIIQAPKGKQIDFRPVAKECFDFVEDIVEENTESTNASKGLQTPVWILETLRLADAQRKPIKDHEDGKKKGRRDGSYLLDFGGVVFDRWPLWPGEA